MRSMRIPTLALFLLLIGCKAPGSFPASGETIKREGKPDVVGVRGSDSAMNQAMESARSSLDELVASLASPSEGAVYSLKAQFEDRGEIEHIWLGNVSYRDGAFLGTIDNEPVGLKNVRLGQEVSVPRERVSDWLIIKDGKFRGGFTIRVLRDQMSSAERAQLDLQMGASPE
jgi:uncharacterized protein YegJ (DUF2314 family)